MMTYEVDLTDVIFCGYKKNHEGHYWWDEDIRDEEWCDGYYLTNYAGSYGDDNDDEYF